MASTNSKSSEDTKTSASSKTTTKKTTVKKSNKTSSSKTSTKNSTSKKSSSKASSTVEKETKSLLSEAIADKAGLEKKDVSKALTKVNKLPLAGKIAVGACFLLGLAGGYVGIRLVQRNDQFSLKNGNSWTITVGETYDYNDIENNVICISYGRNVINTVSVDKANTTLDTTTVGEYKVTYVSSDVKYTKISLVQTVYVIVAEDSYSD